MEEVFAACLLIIANKMKELSSDMKLDHPMHTNNYLIKINLLTSLMAEILEKQKEMTESKITMSNGTIDLTETNEGEIKGIKNV